MDQLFSILTAVLTVTTIIGVALAGLQRGVVSNLRDNNKDLRDADTDRKAKLLEVEVENTTLKSDVAALGRLVRNEAYVIALTDQMHDHHTKAERHWEQDEKLSLDILDALRRLSERSP